jgi:hypothetical protein
MAGAAFLTLWWNLATGNRRRLWLASGALFCAAILLFPSISVSDDIHADAFLFEDSTLGKRVTASHNIDPARPLHLLTAFLLFACAMWFERRGRVLEAPTVFYRTPVFNRHLLGRSPPAISAH